MDFYQLTAMLDQVGGFDILLPFILVFTMVFAVLQKINLFGANKKNINAVISLVIALFFLNNTYLVYTLQRFLPNVSIILVVFLMFLLILGTFAGETQFTDKALGLTFFISIGAVLFALFSDVFNPLGYGDYGGGLGGLYYSIDPGTRFMAWMLLIGVMLVMFGMKDDNSSKNKGKDFGDVLESFGKSINKGK